jgi:hypothetical protein
MNTHHGVRRWFSFLLVLAAILPLCFSGEKVLAAVSAKPELGSAARTSITAHVFTNLTVQEAIYGGIQGFHRQQEPVSVGLPLADSAGIKEVSQLGLAGAKAAQFRVLGRWPSGNIEWVLVDTLADVDAGKANKSISLTSGNGNFGGPDIARDDGVRITIFTGVVRFGIRKKNFNLFDEVIVGDRTLIKAGQSAGLALLGPSAGQTVCPCSTLYASSNDETSSAVIEENGPVRAVVRATGQLRDASGHAYMRYTVRLHFFKGKANTKAVVILQNADYGTSNSFASAYKGFRSFEARLTPNLDATRKFAFGAAHSDVTGSFTHNEDAFLYQAYSDKMEHGNWDFPDKRGQFAPRSYIGRSLASETGSQRTWTYSQEGCVVKHDAQTPAKTGRSEYCGGWAGLSDARGAGIEAGVYQMAAYWPKSFQFPNGGSEVRIGIWPDQSLFGSGSQDYYQAWPQYSIHTLYFDFHTAAISDPEAEFARFQHPLLARAPLSYYNDAKVFFYPILDPKREDQYLQSLGLGCCAEDLQSPHVYRNYSWHAAGGLNQSELRWADLMFWLQRGLSGRYLNASHFYNFQAEQVFPRSDFNGEAPFEWRDRPGSELNSDGLPNITSLNDDIGCDPGEKKCGRNWIDNSHAHWYGMMDYYFMSGDETIRDAIEDGASDIYGNPDIAHVKNGTYFNPRNVGEALMSDARLALFYRSLGSREKEERALSAGEQILSKQVWPELQVSGSGAASQGVSRTRGLHFGCCPPTNRFAMPFQEGILSEGLWEFMQAEGPAWPRGQLTFDLAYGIAEWTLKEAWRTDALGELCNSGTGLTYEIFIDRPNNPLYPACAHTIWFNFYNYAKYTGDPGSWTKKFEQYIKHINGNGVFYGELGTIFEGAVIGEILNPEPLQLVNVPVQLKKLDSGRYSLSWTVPADVQSYRIKYSDKNIVEWLNFDPVTNQFTIDPAANIPWFAASELANPPAPTSPGTVQTFEATGLDQKIEWHFALKAYIQRKTTAP